MQGWKDDGTLEALGEKDAEERAAARMNRTLK